MKTLLVVAFACFFVFFVLKPNLAGRLTFPKTADPAQAMAALRKEFPDRVSPDPDHWQTLKDICYDVQKTDSLVNPIAGKIDFQAGVLSYRMTFTWKENRWVFSRLICMNNGTDHTNTSGGSEFLNRPEMQQFLARCR